VTPHGGSPRDDGEHQADRELAERAARRGARVTVVAANVALPRSPGVIYVDVGTAAELKAACEDAFPACDVLLMAAAVADFRPAERREDKIKKDAAGAAPVVALERTEDVLSGLAAARRPEQVLIGFAAETGAGTLEYGRGKLARKQLDAVVVNDVAVPGIGFDAADNEVWIVTADGEHHVPKTSKEAVATAILDSVLSRSSSNDTKVR